MSTALPPPAISDADRALIGQLRDEHRRELTVKYDTDFNLLRWLIGYDRDVQAASKALGRHLKVGWELFGGHHWQIRRVFNLDEVHKVTFTNVAFKFMPITFVGESGLGNNLFLNGDRTALYDSYGLMKSLNYAQYFLYHMQVRFMEKSSLTYSAMGAHPHHSERDGGAHRAPGGGRRDVRL